VILSGGDPLVNPEGLKYALDCLNKLNQIEVIRIHTRVPIVKPKLLDKKIMDILKLVKNKPLYLSLHVNSTEEITKEVEEKIWELRKLGVLLFSQSVFLKGVNDSIEELAKLFTKLHHLGVRPYNIYHCSNVEGIEKYRVDLKTERKLMTELKKKISGLAYPALIIDAPGSAEKIPVPLEFWKCEMNSFVNFAGEEIKDF